MAPTVEAKSGHGTWPVFGTFFLSGFVLGNWIPRIPDVKVLHQLSATELGLALFAIAMGTLCAFLMIGRFIASLGLRRACMVSVPTFALGVALTPFVPNYGLLLFVAWITGIGIGVVEVAMNTAADLVEKRGGKQIMSRAHGFWSLGSLIGALIGTAFAYSQIPITLHFPIIMSAVIVFGLFPTSRVLESEKSSDEVAHSTLFTLPHKSLVLLCVMPIGIMLVEGAFIDWSALFVKSVLDGGPLATGLIFSAFALLMTITRLCGDWLVAKWGAVTIARYSALSATVGIFIFATAQNVQLAFVGAIFSGLGVAILYPQAMAAAARRPGRAEDNVAAMSLFAFFSFMVAPPTIGILADLIGLRYSMLLLVPLAATSFFLSSELDETPR